MSTLSGTAGTGMPITWTAAAGSGASLEYRFWRFSQTSGAWTIVQDYSAANSYTWTPSAGEEGNYMIQVWARVQGSSNNYESWKSSGWFAISNQLKVGSLEASVALPASTGTTITWTAKATGGPGPLQYRFWRFHSGTWTMVRDYSSDPTYTWTPGASEEGTYTLQVWVRRAGSTANYDAWRPSDVIEIKNGPLSIASLTANRAFPTGTGAAITWKAVSAGVGPLEYQFWRQQLGGAWTIAQAYSPSDSYTWTPTAQGTYALQVWVRRQGSTAAYEAWLGTGYFDISNTPLSVTISADAGVPIGTGAPVSWTAKVTGGPGPYEYRFYLFNAARETWALVQDYGLKDTFTWTPSIGDAGSYLFQAWVRRVGSGAVYDAWTASGFFTVAGGAPSILSLTGSTGQQAVVGAPVTWTAKPAGGEGPLEYSFWMLNQATQVWTELQSYSWDRSFDWVPTVGQEGTYIVQVRVRRSSSTAPFEGWSSAPFEVLPRP